MNKLKLGLSNFQSISDGELEFETGLNFIIGQSNSGKSATFRALKACLSNPTGSQRFIKKGHSCAEVSLEYNGNTIIWKRTKSESSYEINGEKYVKTGKSDAFKILDNIGFARDFNDIIMNIEEELQLPFPYGISKFDLFKLFEDVFCVSDSAIILKSAKEHENQVKDEIVLLEGDILKTKKKIEELEKFKEETDLNKLASFKNTLITQKNRIDFLNEGMDIIQKAVKASAVAIPEQKDFKNLYEEHVGLEELLKVVDTTKKLHNLAGTLKKAAIPKVIDVREYKSLEDLLRTSNRLKALSSINLPKSLELKEDLMKERDNLMTLKKVVYQIQELHKIKLPVYAISSKLGKYTELKRYMKELEKIIAEGRALKAKRNKVQEKVNALEEKLKEYKVCPLCHRPV